MNFLKSFLGEGGGASTPSWLQPAAAPAPAPVAAPAPAPAAQQSYSSLQSLFPNLDINRVTDPNYMLQFADQDGGPEQYKLKGADGQMYGLGTTLSMDPSEQGGSINVTRHTGSGDSGGGQYYEYGRDGNNLMSRDFKNDSNGMRDFIGMGAMMLAPMIGGGMFGTMGDAAGAGTGAAMGTNGAFLGEGAASGIGAWDSALSAAQAGGAAVGGTGAMGAGAYSPEPFTFNPAMDSQAANAAIDAGGGNALAGYGSTYGLPTGSAVGGTAASGLGSLGSQLGTKAATSGLGSIISSALGGGSSGGTGSGLSGLGGLVTGGLDYYERNKAAGDMLDYMKAQQAKIDSIYSPDGPMAKTMYGQMSAQDAAAGRNSQYGTRTTDFLGKFGGDYARNTASLAQGLAGNYQSAFNQQASAGTGLATATNKFLSSGAGQSLVQNVGSYLGGSSSPGSQMGSGNNDSWAQGWGQALNGVNNGGGGDYIYG